MKTLAGLCSLFSSVILLHAHDDRKVHSGEAEVGAEIFLGRRGYLHSGAELSIPFSETQTFGIVGHMVREDSEGEWFPSIGANYHQEFSDGLSLMFHVFGYTEVEDESALAAGFRFSKEFELGKEVKLTAFGGPTFARVKATGESGSEEISHWMAVAGVTLDYSQFEVGAFGTGSFYDRNPDGLETHVDLQEMTQLSAYENNDGLPDGTIGFHVGYRVNPILKLSANYAGLFFRNETRHTYTLMSSLKVGPHVELKAGFQMLRDGETENDMLVMGTSVSF